MAWVPFIKRSDDIKQLVAEISDLDPAVSSPEEFYNQNDCGLQQDEDLAKTLLRSHASILETNRNLQQPNPRYQEENHAADVLSLKYLKERANSYADRLWAEMLYEELLVKLWVQHVEYTGETYYPRLSDDLFEVYELSVDDYHV